MTSSSMWDLSNATCLPGTASQRKAERRSVFRLRAMGRVAAAGYGYGCHCNGEHSGAWPRHRRTGFSKVTSLFECHAWPTVWQMISVFSARTRSGITVADVFASLFPCGSITGAPKLRAMHWIRNLERGPRGVYCGAVGVIQPGGAARFNWPIRTVSVRDGRAKCGIGSGVTWSSAAGAEWSEWTHKAGFSGALL